MEKQQEKNNNKDYYSIDVLHIAKALWRRAWIIAIVGILTASVAFCYASFGIEPSYSSSVMLYVNNTSISLGGSNFTISASQITAAQSLVKTYSEILKNRTTLERIIDKSGVDLDWRTLSAMITAAPSNETEIMKVTVVAHDPYEASNLANCIAEVLPVRITEIIDGATMEVVDSAVPNVNKIAPSITNYTAIGMILGVVAAVIFLSIAAMLDDTIHDEDYVLQTYEYPILAKVPNLLGGGSSRYGYRRYGYYYQSKSRSDNTNGGVK